MKPEEIELIKTKHNAAIIAPAGHGKTEMITELVDKLPGKKLVLTHTNAGVDALKQRMNRKNINIDKYNLSTISSFCMKWCEAYPKTALVDSSISMSNPKFYTDQYNGTGRIFAQKWARNLLGITYNYIIVDEYQDCIEEQHNIFININISIPVYVLGDPLQSIFGWAGKLVSWTNMEFEIVEVETAPHRWERTNTALGEYLTDIRKALLPSLEGKRVCLNISPIGEYIQCIAPKNARDYLIEEIKKYQSVLFLTKWPRTQCSFSQMTGGIFQNDEPQNLKDLYTYAQYCDSEDGYMIAKRILEFISICSTHTDELDSYKKHIAACDFDFSRIKKYPEFGYRMRKLYIDHGKNDILAVLEWIKANPEFRLYRRELFFELMRSIRIASDRGITIHQAAQQIRMMPNNQSRYAGFKFLSSRAVLSKGLEFDYVAINLQEEYTSTEMYVAMTRAMKGICFITDQDRVWLNVPEGVEMRG